MSKDLVFAEMAEGCKRLVENSLKHHQIHEVTKTVRQRIASEWLDLQQEKDLTLATLRGGFFYLISLLLYKSLITIGY